MPDATTLAIGLLIIWVVVLDIRLTMLQEHIDKLRAR